MQLFPHQRTGAQWLAGRQRFGLLADDMGIGKSAQAVAAADLLDEGRVTVVCPAIMCDAWRATFADFGDLPRDVSTAGAERLSGPQQGVFVTSYERAQRPDVAATIADRGGVVVLDEAHYLKDPESKRSQGIFATLSGNKHRVHALTGTPIANHAGELFPLFRFAGLWSGDYMSFVRRYCVTRDTDYGFAVMAHRNVDELRQMLATVSLRRRHQVVLPPTDYKHITIPLGECDTGDDAFRQFRERAPTAARRVAGLVGAGNLNGLDDAETATVRRLVGCLKVLPCAHRIGDVLDRDPTNKVVVFCIHSAPLALLSTVLESYGVVEFTGDTPKKKTGELVARFQTDPACRVALCQMKAAGVGITLTAANYLIVVERPWSPADEDQATRRIIRIGQTRPTFVRYVSLEDSIDQAVNTVLQRKARLIDEIIN